MSVYDILYFCMFVIIILQKRNTKKQYSIQIAILWGLYSL